MNTDLSNKINTGTGMGSICPVLVKTMHSVFHLMFYVFYVMSW